jgi:peroxiredoxin
MNMSRLGYFVAWSLVIAMVALGFRWPEPLAMADEKIKADPVKTNDLPPVLLQMMRNTEVHDHLKLETAVSRQTFHLLDELDGRWWRSRNLGDEQRRETVDELSERLRGKLKESLTPIQWERVLQLERQAWLTKDDRVKVEKMSPREIAAIYGEPFDFESLKRVFPRAPELVAPNVTATEEAADGEATIVPAIEATADTKPDPIAAETWLIGPPRSLRSLRGQVVVVHFYAFQCINCVRNLPHYQAWHRDLADSGVVLVGIQTPETATERDADAVAEAAKAAGIEYSVLFDAESRNWAQWGNTMWPTVYLIDKQGYIRSWWQGELNWEGQQGEQAMRANIKKLLAE